jgi:predicted nuclease with TOPRIM domain
MNNEKMKDIKEKLQEEVFIATRFGDKLRKVPTNELKDLLTLINELESENERLKQSNKNILFVNEKVIERNQELEESLLDMVVQFCQIGKEGYLHHTFMSAEENAFDVLDIEYGENVDDVYKRFNEKWGRNN